MKESQRVLLMQLPKPYLEALNLEVRVEIIVLGRI